MEVSFLEQDHWEREALGERQRTLVWTICISLKKKKKVNLLVSRSKIECLEKHCLHIFHLQNLSLSFWPYPMFRVFCWWLKSRVTEGGVWLVPLTACSWMMQFSEVCSNSLQIICTLSSSSLVQSTSGSVPGLENSLIEHCGGEGWGVVVTALTLWTFG